MFLSGEMKIEALHYNNGHIYCQKVIVYSLVFISIPCQGKLVNLLNTFSPQKDKPKKSKYKKNLHRNYIKIFPSMDGFAFSFFTFCGNDI